MKHSMWRRLQNRLSSYSQKISMFHGLFFYCSLFQNPDWLPVYKPAFTTNAENFFKFVITERGKCTQLHHDHLGKISQIFLSLCQSRHTNFKLIWQEKSINQEINSHTKNMTEFFRFWNFFPLYSVICL